MDQKTVDMEEFKEQVRGKPYNSLIQYHLKRQSSRELENGIKGTIAMLPTEMLSAVEMIIDFWNLRAKDAVFFRRDCADVFEEIIWETELMFSKRGIQYDEESLFNVFQIITLNFASMASTQPKLRKFAGIKKGWFS